MEAGIQTRVEEAAGVEAEPAPMVAASPPVAPPAAGVARASRVRRTLIATAFVSVVVAVAAGLILLALIQEQPAWWRKVDVKSAATADAAARLENGVATILTSARPPNQKGDPDKPWTVALPAADANAWLNARLPKWLESRDDINFRWPEELSELQVEFADGRIHVGAKVSKGGKTQVFSATLVPQFRTDGSLWMPAQSVSMGRLKLPASWLLSEPDAVASGAEVPENLAGLPQTRAVLGAFAGKHAVMTQPAIRLGDGRRVRILGLHAKDGRLLITCQTEVGRAAGPAVDAATAPDPKSPRERVGEE